MSEEPEDLRQWRLPRGRHGLPRELVERSQRERLLAAVVRVTAANGYEATTVGDILGEAGVGRESFYELFDDKRDCMLAAHKILVDDLEERVRVVYVGERSLAASGARSALAVTLDWFAADPEAARFILVELSTVGPAFRAIFKDEFGRFTACSTRASARTGPSPARPGDQPRGRRRLARIYEEVVLGRAAELPGCCPSSPTSCWSLRRRRGGARRAGASGGGLAALGQCRRQRLAQRRPPPRCRRAPSGGSVTTVSVATLDQRPGDAGVDRRHQPDPEGGEAGVSSGTVIRSGGRRPRARASSSIIPP